jgi:glycosyl-4,4'-diaponeurosporenoate acyltransferase
MRLALIILANCLGWPVIHLSVARWILARPSERFHQDNWITRERPWERSGAVYRSWFHVHRWKDLLPDGAPWLGGMPKRTLTSTDPAYLATFMAETRRGEIAHWTMLAATPIFYLWNPLWASLVITSYGVLANLPCILVQRANRIRLVRVAAGRRLPA